MFKKIIHLKKKKYFEVNAQLKKQKPVQIAKNWSNVRDRSALWN